MVDSKSVHRVSAGRKIVIYLAKISETWSAMGISDIYLGNIVILETVVCAAIELQ